MAAAFHGGDSCSGAPAAPPLAGSAGRLGERGCWAIRGAGLALCAGRLPPSVVALAALELGLLRREKRPSGEIIRSAVSLPPRAGNAVGQSPLPRPTQPRSMRGTTRP